MSVVSAGKNDSIALPENLRSQDGRIRQFKFYLGFLKEELNLTWIDESGKPELNATQGEW